MLVDTFAHSPTAYFYSIAVASLYQPAVLAQPPTAPFSVTDHFYEIVEMTLYQLLVAQFLPVFSKVFD